MSLCKDYLKDCSTGRAGLNGYSAVMYAHDFMNQGQPKAYSAKLAASGFIYAEEWFKYRSPGWLVLFSWGNGGGGMYLVSDGFLRAVKSNTRKYYWTGTIVTRGGMTYEFGSKEIVKGSGYISRQCWKKRRTIFINNHIGVRPHYCCGKLLGGSCFCA